MRLIVLLQFILLCLFATLQHYYRIAIVLCMCVCVLMLSSEGGRRGRFPFLCNANQTRELGLHSANTKGEQESKCRFN